MKEKIRLIGILLLIIIIGTIVFLFSNKKNVNIIYPSVVKIECKNNNTESTGSGIVYDTKKNKQFIVTNYHIIKGYSSVKVYDQHMNSRKATIVGFDDTNDIAVLTVSNSLDIKKAIFEEYKKTIIDEDVYILTSSLGEDNTYIIKDAVFKSKEKLKIDNKNINTFRINYNVEEGDSGSPVINKKGKVIAMMFLKNTQIKNIGYALPIFNVLDVAKKIEKSKDKITLGALMTNVTNIQLLKEYNIDKNIDKGVVILSIKNGYPISNSGLKKGDTIVEFNGEKITKISELKNAIKQIEGQKKINIKYYRKGKQNMATINLKM